jgi:hypothetical protein
VVANETHSTTDQDVDEEGDDLNAFMDEFEMNTQGENFRRPCREAE